MAFKTLLDHTCDIYHIQRSDTSPGYDLPSSPSFNYPKQPDLAAVPCHFGVTHSTVAVVQADPQANLEAKLKLALPAGTDVRLNDKIVDCTSGYEYTAEVPRNIRGHHVTVLLHRTGQQEPL